MRGYILQIAVLIAASGAFGDQIKQLAARAPTVPRQIAIGASHFWVTTSPLWAIIKLSA